MLNKQHTVEISNFRLERTKTNRTEFYTEFISNRRTRIRTGSGFNSDTNSSLGSNLGSVRVRFDSVVTKIRNFHSSR